MWWRVTGLALIMCGSSPKNIGSVAWKEHPTLRTLMKMVTSDRYKFPTVDCDEAARDNMKSTEQSMRDEVSRGFTKSPEPEISLIACYVRLLGVKNYRAAFPPEETEEEKERNLEH